MKKTTTSPYFPTPLKKSPYFSEPNDSISVRERFMKKVKAQKLELPEDPIDLTQKEPVLRKKMQVKFKSGEPPIKWSFERLIKTNDAQKSSPYHLPYTTEKELEEFRKTPEMQAIIERVDRKNGKRVFDWEGNLLFEFSDSETE